MHLADDLIARFTSRALVADEAATMTKVQDFVVGDNGTMLTR
jgi:hypothetical protein